MKKILVYILKSNTPMLLIKHAQKNGTKMTAGFEHGHPGIFPEFISGTTTEHISSSIHSLQFSSLSLVPSCSSQADVLIIIALSELWKAHWRSIFDN
jgi:hypothetical protein